MKKQYTTPEMKVVNFNSADIICTSDLGFGSGSTDSMNSRDSFFDDSEDDPWAF